MRSLNIREAPRPGCAGVVPPALELNVTATAMTATKNDNDG